MVENIIKRCIVNLQKQGLVIAREECMKWAENEEKAGSVATLKR